MSAASILISRPDGSGYPPAAVSVGDVIGFPRNGLFVQVRVKSWASDGAGAHIVARTKTGKEYLFSGRQLKRLVLIRTAAEDENERNKPPRAPCAPAEFENWYMAHGGHFETVEFAHNYHARGGDVTSRDFAQACADQTGLLPYSARGDGGSAMLPCGLTPALPVRPADDCDKRTFAAYFAAHGGASGDMDEAYDWHREGWDVLTPEYRQARDDAYEDDAPPSE